MSQYSRLLVLDSLVKERLTRWLNSILTNHLAERALFLDELMENQQLYWAEPQEAERRTPFKGAANIIIPIGAIAFETVHANNMQQFRALEQVVNVQALNPEWIATGSAVEKYCNKELIERMQFFESIEDAIIDLEKHGTGVGKAGYEKLIKYGVRETPDGEEEFPVVVKQGPFVQSVPLYRFLQPFSAKDAQLAPWCGEEHEDTYTEIQNMENSGFFDPGITEKLRSYIKTPGINENSKIISEIQRAENRSPSQSDSIVWYEVWCSFDVDMVDELYDSGVDILAQTKGNPKEIICYYHQESNELLGVRYNTNSDLRRPYRHGVYFPVEHRWRGIGIFKQIKMFQYEVTAQHRQRLDNATIANMRMFKVSKVSGYGPGEPIFPGKMWLLDDMDHIDTIQTGEIYPSSFNNEQSTIQYYQQRVGISDINMGMASAGTPGTATDIMARVREGKKRSDYTNGNIRLLLSSLLQDSICEIQQYGPSRVEYYDVVENGMMVKEFFALPETMIRDNLILQFKLSNEQNNDLTDRNNWTQVAGFIQQYITGALQLAQSIGDPQLMQRIAVSGLTAATMAFKQMLETYKLTGVDKMYVKELIENGLGMGSSEGFAGGGITQGNPILQIPPGGATMPGIMPTG